MDFGIHILAPFPGTEVREKADEYGITVLTDDWDLYDANRSVCSTNGISPEKVDKTVHGFYESLEKYMEDAALKKKNGETISEKDEHMLRKAELYNFNMELIKNRIIENFNGSASGSHKDLLKSFSLYLQEKTGRDHSFVMNEVNRMLQRKCIEVTTVDSGLTIGWV